MISFGSPKGAALARVWIGDIPQAIVLGIGVNATRAAVPALNTFTFPATTLEEKLGRPVARLDLLKKILQGLLFWRTRMMDREFIAAWESHLAYQQQLVEIREAGKVVHKGKIKGLGMDGSLRLGPCRAYTGQQGLVCARL
jgi:biotin-(acetyl-CoA carboxylase) ligase